MVPGSEVAQARPLALRVDYWVDASVSVEGPGQLLVPGSVGSEVTEDSVWSEGLVDGSVEG